MKRKLSVALIGVMTVSMLAGCGQGAAGTAASSADSQAGGSAQASAESASGESATGAADTITVMVPPVTDHA